MNASHSKSSLGASLSALAALVAPGAGRPLPRAGRGGRLMSRAAGIIRLWLRRARDRRELMSLDDRMLRDIGLSRGEVEAEGRKPFWRA